MLRFILKIVIYLLSFVLSLYGLNALDFNRFVKKGKIAQAQTLFILIAMIMAYLLGGFIMSAIYYFN